MEKFKFKFNIKKAFQILPEKLSVNNPERPPHNKNLE